MYLRPRNHLLSLLVVSGLVPMSLTWAQLTKYDIYPPGAAPANIGTYTPGANGSFTITSDGTPWFSNVSVASPDGTGDVLTFAAEKITGDFDKRVQITSISADESRPGDPWTRGALMVRTSDSHHAVSFHIFAGNPYNDNDSTTTPDGANQVGFAGRALDAQNYTWWGRPLPGVKAALPNQWLRLRRVGDSFTAYVGTNGVNWTLIGQRYQILPAELLVGPYASSGFAGTLATVEFASYGNTPTSDNVAPALVSAGTLDKKAVGVRFSEAVSSSTATKVANYEITQPVGGAVTINSVKMGIAGDAVYLDVSGLTSDTFSVKVIGGITDTAGNSIAANSTVSARALNWNHGDIGLIKDPANRPTPGDDPGTVGQAVMISSDENPEIEIVGGGSNQWDPGDFIHYVWRTEPLSGNFDVTIAVSRNDRPANTAGWANSGIMLRASPYLPGQEFTVAGTKTKHVVNSTYIEGAGVVGGPNRGSIPLWRRSDGGNYGNGNAGFSAYNRVIGGVKGYYSELRGIDASGNVDPQSAPDTARYLRIKRVGTSYTFYASWNRTDWAIVDGPISLPELPDELLLGFSTMNDTGAGAPPNSGYAGNGHELDPNDPYHPSQAGGRVQNDSNYSVQRIKVFPNGVTDPLPVVLTKDDIRPADGSSTALSGSWTSVGTYSFNMTGGGSGVFRNTGSAETGGDELTFAHESITGDFDKQVAISSIATLHYNGDGSAIVPENLTVVPPVDAWARAGLMARASNSAYSQVLKIVAANPAGANQVRVVGRGIDAQNYTQYSRNYPGVSDALPNQFLRMKRAGNAFSFYVSTDGVVWSMIAQTYQEMPATILFGAFTAAGLNPADTAGNPDGLIARTAASFTAYKDVDLGDVAGPSLVSAGTMDKVTIGVKFNEAVDSATATVAANYTLSQGTVSAARVGIGGDSVYLTVSGLTANNFTVTVNNVKDSFGNAIAAGSMVSGSVAGLASSDIGYIQDPANRPTPGDDPYRVGQAVPTSSDAAPEVEIIGGGSNAWDPGDYIHYLYNPTPITGDFDVAVKVSRNDRNNNGAGWANSGVMLRSALYTSGSEYTPAGTKAQMVTLTTYTEGSGSVGGPNRGAIPLFRKLNGGGYGNGNAGFAAYNNPIGGVKGYYTDLRAINASGALDAESSPYSARWLRIKRTGNSYAFSASWDGLTWAAVDTVEIADIDPSTPLLIGYSTMNDTGAGAPPQSGYAGNGHTIDPLDPLNPTFVDPNTQAVLGRVQNESNYSVQKVRIFPDATRIGLASISRLADGKVSVSFVGTLASSSSLNGPWTPVARLGSPYVLTPGGSRQYFRVIP